MGMPTLSLHRDASTAVGVGHLDSRHTQAHDDLPKICPLGFRRWFWVHTQKRGLWAAGRALQGQAQG